jgi:glycosyltransferase involved in cell wall biosynthesis
MNYRFLILHATHLFGGAEKSLLDWLATSSLREDLTVMALPGTVFYNRLRQTGIPTLDADIYYSKKADLKKHPWKCLKNLLMTSWAIKRVCRKNRIQAIYCHTHRSLPYAFFPKLTGVKVVTGCRDTIRTRWEKQMIRLMSNRIIAVSHYISDQLGQRKPVEIISGPIRIPEPSGNLNLRNAYYLPKETVCIGTIGQLVPWKNQLDFIRMAARLIRTETVPLHFFLIGASPDEKYKKMLTDELDKNRLADYVTFTGFVPDPEEWITQMDMVVHTAIGEPFGRILVEVMATGHPVVAYASGGPLEILQPENDVCLVPPHDLDALAEILRSFIANPAVCESVRQKGQAFVRKHYDPATTVARFDRVMREMVEPFSETNSDQSRRSLSLLKNH